MQTMSGVQHPVPGEEGPGLCVKASGTELKVCSWEPLSAYFVWGKVWCAISRGLRGTWTFSEHRDQWLPWMMQKGDQALSWEASVKEVWEAVVKPPLTGARPVAFSAQCCSWFPVPVRFCFRQERKIKMPWLEGFGISKTTLSCKCPHCKFNGRARWAD